LKINDLNIYILDGRDFGYHIEVSHSKTSVDNGGSLWRSGDLFLTEEEGKPILAEITRLVNSHIEKVEKKRSEGS